MTQVLPALMSSARTGEKERDLWRTPTWLIDRIVGTLGPIGLDPCAVLPPDHGIGVSPTKNRDGDFCFSTVGAIVEWAEGGLSASWRNHGLVYVNFPYSQAEIWAAKCSFEAGMGTELVVLAAARTETKAWQKSLWRAQRVLFMGKTPDGSRIHFIRPDGSVGKQPAFPSALCYFGPRPDVFASLRDLGAMVAVIP